MCDPKVGACAQGPPSIAAKLCYDAYDSCMDEFFAAEVLGYPVPCGSKHTVCSKLGEWYEDGPQLCKAVGFEPVQACNGCCCDGVTYPALPTTPRNVRRQPRTSPAVDRGNQYLFLVGLVVLFSIAYYTNWSNVYSFLQSLLGTHYRRGRGRKLGRR